MKQNDLDKIKKICEEFSEEASERIVHSSTENDRQYFIGKKHMAKDILNALNSIKVEDETE